MNSTISGDAEELRWFVMRDLKRANSKTPAWSVLADQGMEIFTPMKLHVRQVRGRKVKERRPVIQDLLFVHDTEQRVKAVADKIPTLQFRYVKGGKYCQPMVVRDSEMEHFIRVANGEAEPRFYSPDELTADMAGRRIKITAGVLEGLEGVLLTVRGSRKKQILVNIPDVLAASVAIDPDFIEFIP